MVAALSCYAGFSHAAPIHALQAGGSGVVPVLGHHPAGPIVEG